MLKRKRIGVIVWGVILFGISGIFVLMCLESNASGIVLFPGILLMVSLVMVIGGIINAVSVTKYNNELLRRGTKYLANCPFCKKDIKCTIADFRPHGRYPEGFIYCPVCKKPVSKNAFTEVE